MKSLREDETTRVSAILNPEQQKKYEADAKQMQAPPSQAPGGFPPPPPPGFPGAIFELVRGSGRPAAL
jgi:hypothetical protein